MSNRKGSIGNIDPFSHPQHSQGILAKEIGVGIEVNEEGLNIMIGLEHIEVQLQGYKGGRFCQQQFIENALCRTQKIVIKRSKY